MRLLILLPSMLYPPDSLRMAIYKHSQQLINPYNKYQAITDYSTYNFWWIKDSNTNWPAQASICLEKPQAFLTWLFHHNMDTSLVMQLPDNLLKQTMHHFFVDNNIYGDIFDSYAANIEALHPFWQIRPFGMAGPTLAQHMPISFSFCILRQSVNTHILDIETSLQIIAEMLQLLPQRQRARLQNVFHLQDIESITG